MNNENLKSEMVRQIADFFAGQYESYEFTSCGGSSCCQAVTDCGNDCGA